MRELALGVAGDTADVVAVYGSLSCCGADWSRESDSRRCAHPATAALSQDNEKHDYRSRMFRQLRDTSNGSPIIRGRSQGVMSAAKTT